MIDAAKIEASVCPACDRPVAEDVEWPDRHAIANYEALDNWLRWLLPRLRHDTPPAHIGDFCCDCGTFIGFLDHAGHLRHRLYADPPAIHGEPK